VGLTLDEIQNDITKETPASFEPTLDYVVAKIPRWPFDKFKGINKEIGVQMKSTGEVMSIGRTLEESIHKAIRSLDIGRYGFDDVEYTDEELINPTDNRLFQIYTALKSGKNIEEICELTNIDPLFIRKIENVIKFETQLMDGADENGLNLNILRKAKRMGFSDRKLSEITRFSEYNIRNMRIEKNITPTYKMVDTCAAEFEAKTPYYYSTYEDEDEVAVSNQQKVIIIGAGPIRIGQGI